jgi:zinc transport system substrate-binding protein
MSIMRNFLILLICMVTLGCEPRNPDTSTKSTERDSDITVVTSNYPLYFFALQITEGIASGIDIRFPEIEGDPANWKPDSTEITELQNASLVVLNGAGYESWLGWVTLPEDRLLDTSLSFADRLISLDSEIVHQHGPEGDHSDKGTAFTIWLDPLLAIEQARSIHGALSRLLPTEAEVLNTNLDALIESLRQLDQKQASVFRKVGNQEVLFSHPVYQYLQARYGINGSSVHWEPGETPSTRAWIDLGEILAIHPARLMLWEDAPLAETQSDLNEKGISAIAFHTASNRPGEGNYLNVMAANIQRLDNWALTQ